MKQFKLLYEKSNVEKEYNIKLFLSITLKLQVLHNEHVLYYVVNRLLKSPSISHTHTISLFLHASISAIKTQQNIIMKPIAVNGCIFKDIQKKRFFKSNTAILNDSLTNYN